MSPTPATAMTASSRPIAVSIHARLRALHLPALHEKVRPPVLRPANLAMIGALRSFLSIADRDHSCRRDALGDEVVHRGLGAPITEGKVVLFGAPLVAVPFDQDVRVRVGPEPSCIRIEDFGVARSDRILVEIEINVDEITNTDEFAGRGPRIGGAGRLSAGTRYGKFEATTANSTRLAYGEPHTATVGVAKRPLGLVESAHLLPAVDHAAALAALASRLFPRCKAGLAD